MRTPKPPAFSISSMANPMEGAYGVASAEGKDEDMTESNSTCDDPIELAIQRDPSSQSVQAADVVCGRGKMAFNHGTEIFVEYAMLTALSLSYSSFSRDCRREQTFSRSCGAVRGAIHKRIKPTWKACDCSVYN
jgi:hypothetical protein